MFLSKSFAKNKELESFALLSELSDAPKYSKTLVKSKLSSKCYSELISKKLIKTVEKSLS